MADEPIAFEIGGVAYQARRMDLLTQLEIVAKLAPLMASGLAQILQLFEAVAEEITDAPPDMRSVLVISRILALPKGRLIERLGPLMAEFARMPGADQRFILSTTLASVQRNAGTGTAPRWETVWPAGLAAPTAAEFRSDLVLALRVVGTVLAATLGPFTPGSR